MFENLYRQSISVILSASLLSSSLAANPLNVDASASLSNRPMLESAPNGVPLVNIVTPNATGLSHNKFSDFNVNPQGLILNNATSAAQTQLGGWVPGNANLGTTPARVIINEVTGTSRTLLRGYTEVAGYAADVIVANPNGITVNGGGFINTPRATLTTGTPNYHGGEYNGLSVRGGDILIEGSGMVADNIDRLDLYTKTLQLNAQLHAKRLDVITGENDVAADGSYTVINGTGTQSYSIDSSALGGIYANTITLIATDAGVGVNLPEITYARDSLELRADGKIIVGAALSDGTLTSSSHSLDVNGIVYAKDRIDLKAAGTIHNTQGSSIISDGDIVIHDTGILFNDAATIEAHHDLSIQAGAMENLSAGTVTKTTTNTSSGRLDYFASDFRDWCTTSIATDSIVKSSYSPAYMLSGNDMFLEGAIHNRYSLISADRDLYLSGLLNNEAAINAHEIIDISHYVEHWEEHSNTFNSWWGWYHNYSYYEHFDTITDHLYSSINAGRHLYGNLTSVNNADVTQGGNLSSLGIASASLNRNQSSGGFSYALPSGDTGSFVLATDPSHNYLIESNPLFTDYNTFVSSDYIMSRLNLNMASDTKRLGDARYETQLVRDAVFRLTGERYLAGFGSDTTQYQALMDNALAVQGDLKLEFGVTLSASQVASLNRDIVWMEERFVSGQKALVPVVYLTSLKNQELSAGGKIIAGGDMVLAVQEKMLNGGELRAGGNLIVAADSITNTAGIIASTGDMLLHTTNDITNTSGTISGNNVALVSENGNIVSQTVLKNIDLNSYAGTTGNLSLVGERASIQSNGDMLVNAKKEITLTGSKIGAGGNAMLGSTTGNITLTSAEQNSHYKTAWSNGSSEIEKVTQHASILNVNGNVNLDAAKEITVNSSNINGKDVTLNAGENVNVTASNNRDLLDVKTSSKGFMSKKSTRDMTIKESVVSSNIAGENIQITSGADTTFQAANVSAKNALNINASGNVNILAGEERSMHEHVETKSGWFSGGGNLFSSKMDSKNDVSVTAIGSTLDGKTVNITSGEDTRILGSNVVGENDVTLSSNKSMNIDAAKDQYSSNERHEKSGWGIYGSSGGLGFTIGQQQTSDTFASNGTTQSQSRSMVGSINGNLALNAAENITVKGSDLVAKEDMSIQAKKVTLQESEDTASTQETHEFRQSGLTVALTGSVVSAAQTADQMQQTSQKSDNPRLKALTAMTMGLGALSAYGDVAGGGTNAIGVSATIGNTQSKSESTSQSLVHSGSSATAGGDISVIATGGGANSDLTISGSDITAGKNITLKADDAITLKASEDTYSNHSSSSYSSGGIGMAATVGSGGGQVGFTVNASFGRGRTNGDDTLINNTHVTANDTLIISSGGDTTLKGAVAKADMLKADVGGNLAIESLQDTSTYASKSQSIRGSVTVGWGGASGSVSYAQTDVKSDYASVNEQSGLKAGDGGFQINIANNTDLKGGIISSSQNAIDNNKNSLTTGTFTMSDIDNHASASANTSGFSVGSDMAQGLYGTAKTVVGSAMMFADESGSSSGTTKSAISVGIVNITDDAKQQELTGKTSEQTIASINTDTTNVHSAAIKQDVQRMQEKVEAQQAINQALFKEAVKFTDEAYRTMFLQKAKIVEILKDKNGKVLYDENKNIMTREVSNEEKNNLQKASDGKVHITDNGIFNPDEAAAKYAAQHSNTDGPLYAINFPEAQNGLSEMMIAGYQKYLESDLLGLTNATQETKTAMENYGTEGLHLDGHSRGSLTVANAMDSVKNDPNSKGNLSQTTINFFGPAQNVANADETLGYLQDRDSITDINEKNNMVIKYEAHMADPVARLIGWNDPTGGIVPQTEPIVVKTISGFPLSNENTTFAEMVRAATGQVDTSHNLYFVDFNNFQPTTRLDKRTDLINNFWSGTTPVLMPIRTYTPSEGTK